MGIIHYKNIREITGDILKIAAPSAFGSQSIEIPRLDDLALIHPSTGPAFLAQITRLEQDIGNIIGANILNLTLITGSSAIITPLSIDSFTRYYAFLWLFIMVIGLIIIFWKTGKMGKAAGIVMLSLYVLYNVGLVFYSAIDAL